MEINDNKQTNLTPDVSMMLASSGPNWKLLSIHFTSISSLTLPLDLGGFQSWWMDIQTYYYLLSTHNLNVFLFENKTKSGH